MTTPLEGGHLRRVDVERAATGERIAAQTHLATCGACRDEVEALRAQGQAFVARQPVASFLERHRLAKAGLRPRWWLGLSLVPLAAALVFVVVRPPEPDIRLKGAAFAVLVTRAGQPQALSATERPRAGDRLSFVFTSPSPRHLLVVDLERGSPPAVVFPFGARRSGPLGAGPTTLPDDIALDATQADEWLAAVSCEGPFTLDDVHVEFPLEPGRAPAVTSPGCRVELFDVTRSAR